MGLEYDAKSTFTSANDVEKSVSRPSLDDQSFKNTGVLFNKFFIILLVFNLLRGSRFSTLYLLFLYTPDMCMFRIISRNNRAIFGSYLLHYVSHFLLF